MIVSNSEVHKLQAFVSELRHGRGAAVSVRQLTGAAMLVSTRMAVERKTASEFQNGANRAREGRSRGHHSRSSWKSKK